MRITWYKTASLMLENNKGKKIAIDPYLQYPIKDEKLKKVFQRADRVLITHGHFDHIEHIPEIYKGTETKIFGTATPLRTLVKKGVPKEMTYKIEPGKRLKFGDMHVTAYQSKHCKVDVALAAKTVVARNTMNHPLDMMELLAKNKAYPENGEILFFECEENGKRLQIMGSMNLDPNVEYPTGADALILPFQGRSDQDVYAKQFIKRLKPKRVYLDHYDNAFPPMSKQVDTRFFCAIVEEEFEIPCEAMVFGEKLSI